MVSPCVIISHLANKLKENTLQRLNKVIKKYSVWFNVVVLGILLFSAPLNIVYHFYSEEAYMEGSFVNYLDFVIQIIDIAVIAVLAWNIMRNKLWKNKKFLIIIEAVVGFFALHNLVFRDLVVLYFSTRALLYIMCGISMLFSSDKAYKDSKSGGILLWIVAGGAIIQSVIAGAQFFLGRSLGLKRLGESVIQVGGFNASSVYLPDGYHLRGYGTFPHPNVLGGFLCVVLVLILNELYRVLVNKKRKGGLGKLILIIGSALAVCAGIFFTWSRIAWLTTAILVVMWFARWIWTQKRRMFPFFCGGIVLAATVFFSWISLGNDTWSETLRERLISQSMSGDISVKERTELADRAIAMIKDSAFWGVGLGRFIPNLVDDPVYTSSRIRLMQPAHNVFLLSLTETGIIGIGFWVGLGIFMWRSCDLRKLLTFPTTSLLIVFILTALFDHYWWTLPQGLVIVLVFFPFLQRYFCRK